MRERFLDGPERHKENGLIMASRREDPALTLLMYLLSGLKVLHESLRVYATAAGTAAGRNDTKVEAAARSDKLAAWFTPTRRIFAKEQRMRPCK